MSVISVKGSLNIRGHTWNGRENCQLCVAISYVSHTCAYELRTNEVRTTYKLRKLRIDSVTPNSRKIFCSSKPFSRMSTYAHPGLHSLRTETNEMRMKYV